MQELWQVLDLSAAHCNLRSERGAVVVTAEGKDPVRISVSDLACVLLGMHVRLSGAVLHRLMQEGTAVLLCDWRGVPEGGAYSWRDHSRIAARRRAQGTLSLPRQKNAWKIIVREKIYNQAIALEAIGEESRYLLNLMRKVRSGDSENIEGRAAQYYWKKIFGPSFTRNAGSRAGINGLLDYAYTIARGHAIRAVLAAGLEPSFGVFHRHRENMFCLADDIIEIVRPAVDLGVWNLIEAGAVDVVDCRAELVAIAAGTFSPEGYTIPSVLERVAKSFGQYAEDDEAEFEIPSWKPCCGET
ncbi:type II CRISPR-associated endonuclease Cas1 [Trueperella sp. LYQ141]|uniref:type II CRISPR-associated endonuclease Cas1 n=1 Tax=Trueperella sp. LYQ141 TaxID=3391058 RepID=UPI0039833274